MDSSWGSVTEVSSEPRTGARPPLGLAPSEVLVASMPVRLRLCPG